MTQDDVPRGCEMYLPVSDNPSVIETSVDSVASRTFVVMQKRRRRCYTLARRALQHIN